MESLTGTNSRLRPHELEGRLTLSDSYTIDLSDEDITEALTDFKSSHDKRKSAIVNKVAKEIERLQGFFEDSLKQISRQREALYKQVDDFAAKNRASLTEQVTVIRLALEAAGLIANDTATVHNQVYIHLASLESEDEIDRSDILELKFQLRSCEIASVLSNSVESSISLKNLTAVSVSESNLKKRKEERVGKTEFGNTGDRQVEVAKMKETNEAGSKIGLAGGTKSISRISSTKSSPARGLVKQLSLADDKDAKKLTPQKTATKIQIKSPKESFASPQSSIGKDQDSIKAQKVSVHSVSKMPTGAIKLVVDLDKDQESPSKPGTMAPSKIKSPFKLEGLEDLNEARRKRASTLRNQINRPTTASKTLRPSNPPDSPSAESQTDRLPGSRISLVLPINSIKIHVEETKTPKARRQSTINSSQLKSPDTTFRGAVGLRSPSKDSKKLVAPRTPLSVSSSQFLTYFIPLTCKVMVLQVETESVTTVVIEMPEAFFEGAAWCEAMTQEILYTGGFSELPVSKAWLISPQKRSFLEVSPMLTARHSHQLCAINDLVFAIGGAGPEPLEDCEYFSMRTCTWKKAGSLNFARISPAACVHNGRIYVAGGHDQNSIETYDMAEECFNLLYIILPQAGLAAMTSYNENLMIFQGNKLTEVELSKNSLKEVCAWKLTPCWSPTNILFQEGLVYMVLAGEFMRFNISTQSVEKL